MVVGAAGLEVVMVVGATGLEVLIGFFGDLNSVHPAVRYAFGGSQKPPGRGGPRGADTFWRLWWFARYPLEPATLALCRR